MRMSEMDEAPDKKWTGKRNGFPIIFGLEKGPEDYNHLLSNLTQSYSRSINDHLPAGV